VASNPRFRVLMACQRFFPYTAGAELQALGLARALAVLGADVHVVTTRFTKHLAACETLEGIPVRRLPTVRIPTGNATVASAAGALAQASCLGTMMVHVARRARAFDVVHAHCLSSTALGAAVGAHLAGVPVIVKPSLGGVEGELQKMVTSRAARQLLALVRRIDRFAVTNAAIADELCAVGVAPEKLARVQNGVDLERFRPLAVGARAHERGRLGLPGGPLAIFVGQLVPRKGVAPLLEAWRGVRSGLPDATLVIVGQGELSARVEREAATSDSGVIALGLRRDVADLMRVADVLVLPSRNESFGNVIAEALASGIPVVCGRTGLAQMVALDGLAGRFVEPHDPRSIARALGAILGSPDRGAALGARGPALVQRFDFRAVAQEYLGIYDVMCNAARLGSGAVSVARG
jgi:glycosyltransferase involved in cell wall biosynthesis